MTKGKGARIFLTSKARLALQEVSLMELESKSDLIQQSYLAELEGRRRRRDRNNFSEGYIQCMSDILLLTEGYDGAFEVFREGLLYHTRKIRAKD